MDDTSKILDVSYGNFSCRLEGFDDSVATMKTVVSYFHELAGHDRFMDMAPQAPDMETLARLTEEQSGTPVEVETDGNSVSLRAAVTDVEADAENDDETAPADEIEDDIAALLSDDADATDVVAEDVADENDLDERDVAESDDTEIDLPEDNIVFDDEDESSELDDDLEDGVVAADADDTDEAVTQAEDDADDPTDDSVAAKLRRIRAVVSRVDVNETDAKIEETYTEDNTADDEPVVTGNPLAQRLADLAKRNSERAAEEAGVELHIDDDEDALSADVSAEDLAELEAEFAEEDAAALDADENEAVLQLAPEDRTGSDELSGFAKAMRDTDIAGSDDESGPLVLTPDAEITSSDDDDDFDLTKEVAEAQRSIEAIGKGGKGSDVLNNVNMNTTRILSQADEHLNEPEGRRHRDAFAQLKAAVAATEAARQLGDSGASKRDKDEAFREDLGAHAAEEKIEKAAESKADDIADDATPDDLTSAMEQAAEESAAAAAKVAEAVDDDIVEQPEVAEDIEDTVEDVAEEPAPDVAETPAPSPLKLVSSKIVEPAEKQLDVASARLREIASQKDAGGAPKGGFAEFAAQQGATELVDLLEAAAAYIAFVEGDDDFSRPQVMKKVQAATESEFSREDGLRSFGRLLRQSRIIKLNNGRFQVSEDTRFRPEDKAAQG